GKSYNLILTNALHISEQKIAAFPRRGILESRKHQRITSLSSTRTICGNPIFFRKCTMPSTSFQIIRFLLLPSKNQTVDGHFQLDIPSISQENINPLNIFPQA